jgi:GTP-binding protein EngB required for normal cell division
MITESQPTMPTSERPITVAHPNGAEPDAPLREYLRAKEAVAECLRQTQEIIERAAPWAGERVHDLMAHLGEDRFQLVVVGQFKRGKSSLMNAIIGRQLLPTGTIPVTSAITSLRYGSMLRATIKRAGQAVDEQISVNALPEFITERGNPDNHKRVLSADIEAPAPFLRRGLHFIDTPGIGSAHQHNTATTLRFLPEADAAIFVTAADGPLSDVELHFLDAVRQHVRKLFFVLNKIDQLDPQQREEALSYTAELLSRRLGSKAERVFPFSATRALAAERSNADAMEATGLPALESALASFLNNERRIVFLVAVLDRAIGLLEHVRFMLEIRERAAERTTRRDDSMLAELAKRLDAAEGHRRTEIDRLQQRVSEWAAAHLEPALDGLAADASRALSTKLPSLVEILSATSRDYESRADESIRADLQERAAALLTNIAPRVDALTTDLVDDARRSLTPIVSGVDDVAASVFGVHVDDRVKRTDADDALLWSAARFERDASSNVNVGDIETEHARTPLPHVMAVRLTIRRLSQRLPDRVGIMVTSLREEVLEHLRACVADIDRASVERLAIERRRIESIVAPESRSSKSHTAVPVNAFDELQRLRTNMTALRDALLQHEHLPEAAVIRVAPLQSYQPSEQATGPESSKSLQRNVTATCAICASASDAVFEFLCQYQYAIGRDSTTRSELLVSRGLCATHTWHLERLSSPRGLSLGYPPLLDQMEERIKAIARVPPEAAAARVRELALHNGSCPACAALERAEQHSAERLIQSLQTDQGRARFEQSQWLCLPHLRLVLTGIDDDLLVSMLLRQHARRFGELSESMREYVMKHDARRRSLMTDEEERAYHRALVMLVGERYLFRTETEE